MIPESQDAESLAFQPSRPVCIRCDLFRVLASIYFDNQLLFETHKVNNIATQRLLPPKLLSPQLTQADMPP